MRASSVVMVTALGEVRSVEPAMGFVETRVLALAGWIPDTKATKTVRTNADAAETTLRMAPPIRANTLTSLDFASTEIEPQERRKDRESAYIPICLLAVRPCI